MAHNGSKGKNAKIVLSPSQALSTLLLRCRLARPFVWTRFFGVTSWPVHIVSPRSNDWLLRGITSNQQTGGQLCDKIRVTHQTAIATEQG
jgi:hypothetical protein